MTQSIKVAIPSSSLINENDEKIKAYKVGAIARVLSIFKVDKIIIYRDPILDESDYISELLEYAVTPQYLRKYRFPIKQSLKYVGVLPPLKIPSHKPKTLKTGEVREGVIRQVGPDGTYWVDIGHKALALLKLGEDADIHLKRGARVTVRVCSRKPLVVELSKPQEYWGYRVDIMELSDILSFGSEYADIVVTSRRGRVPSVSDLRNLKNPIFIFGNPKEGVQEIAKRIGLNLEEMLGGYSEQEMAEEAKEACNNKGLIKDKFKTKPGLECQIAQEGTQKIKSKNRSRFKKCKVWNFVPDQGTETVRLEEAVISTLAVYNFCGRL